MLKKDSLFIAKPKKRTAFYGGFAILLVVMGIVIGMTPFQPPTVDQSSEADISYERVKNDLEQIAQHPHPVGSDEHEKVKNYVMDSLEDIGLDVEVQDAISYQYNKASHVQNIITKMDGTDPSGTIMFAAHYDSSFVSPGASDDGYGVAALLETARALQDSSFKNDIVILITDAEEVGLQGAHAFVEQHPLAKEIDTVFNFEARGITGSTVMFETSEKNGGLVKGFQEAAKSPVSSSFLNEVYKLIPNDTDLTVFMDAGMDGLNFASAMGLNSYHTTIDSLDFVNDATMMHHAQYAYDMATYFGNAELDHKADSDGVYFNLFGHTLITYPESLVLPLFVLALLGFIGTVYHGVKRRKSSKAGFLWGMLIFIGSIAVSYGISAIVMKIVGFLTKGKHWLLQYDLHVANIYFVCFLLVIAGVLTLLVYVLQQKIRTLDMIFGSVAGLLIIAGIISFMMPGASFLFVWPLLFCLIGINLVLGLRDRLSVGNNVLVYTALLVPGIILFTFLVDTLYVALTIDAMGIVMVVATFFFMLFIPAFTRLRASLFYALGILVIGVGILTFESVTLGASGEHPIGNEVNYIADANTEEATWGITSEPDVFTEQFVAHADKKSTVTIPAFSKEADMFVEEAPFFSERIPKAALISDETTDGKRTVVLDIEAPGATIFTLQTESALTLHALQLDGEMLDIEVGAYDTGDPFIMNLFGFSDGVELSVTIDADEEFVFSLVHTNQDIPEAFDYVERPDNMATHQDNISVSKHFNY